jgi:hypothetical protein
MYNTSHETMYLSAIRACAAEYQSQSLPSRHKLLGLYMHNLSTHVLTIVYIFGQLEALKADKLSLAFVARLICDPPPARSPGLGSCQ